LPCNAKVLDLCCGAGYESMRLKTLGVSVIGADLSEKYFKFIKELKENGDWKYYILKKK